jgi:hypothetical protein
MIRTKAYVRLLWRICGRPVLRVERRKYLAIKATWRAFHIGKVK